MEIVRTRLAFVIFKNVTVSPRLSVSTVLVPDVKTLANFVRMSLVKDRVIDIDRVPHDSQIIARSKLGLNTNVSLPSLPVMMSSRLFFCSMIPITI